MRDVIIGQLLERINFLEKDMMRYGKRDEKLRRRTTVRGDWVSKYYNTQLRYMIHSCVGDYIDIKFSYLMNSLGLDYIDEETYKFCLHQFYHTPSGGEYGSRTHFLNINKVGEWSPETIVRFYKEKPMPAYPEF